MQVINYIAQIKPDLLLTDQMVLIKKQIAHFAWLSKTDLPYKQRVLLMEAWEACIELRKSTYAKIQRLETVFSLN